MRLGGSEKTSVKGALAFWWRALKYSDFVEQADEDQDKALQDMREREIALFGGESGQGAFSLTVEQDEHDGQTNANSASIEIKEGVGTTYLAYGLLDKRKIERSWLKSGKSFTLKLVFTPQATPKTIRPY